MDHLLQWPRLTSKTQIYYLISPSLSQGEKRGVGESDSCWHKWRQNKQMTPQEPKHAYNNKTTYDNYIIIYKDHLLGYSIYYLTKYQLHQNTIHLFPVKTFVLMPIYLHKLLDGETHYKWVQWGGGEAGKQCSSCGDNVRVVVQLWWQHRHRSRLEIGSINLMFLFNFFSPSLVNTLESLIKYYKLLLLDKDPGPGKLDKVIVLVFCGCVLEDYLLRS